MTVVPQVLAEKSTVQSLAKGFRVLEAFTPAQPELGLAEVARAADLDNGSAFRFLNTLVQLGYVQKVPGTKRFRLTLKCLDLGFHAIARTELRDLARPLLRGLVGSDFEAASLAVLDGSEIVYIERVQAGLARLGVDVRVGSRAPAYSTAVGQVLLAHVPRDVQKSLLSGVPLRRLTAHTLTALPDILKRLDDVATKGFALSDQENVSGLRVLAAPVLDIDRVPVAAVSVAAPAFGQDLATFQKRAQKPVIEVAKTLSRAIQAAGGVAAPVRAIR
jgi:IclR family transcriptional regulator, pca regulon regulatory protein